MYIINEKIKKMFDFVTISIYNENIANELLYDIACLHFISERYDGDVDYISQFGEDVGFKYREKQVQEYLYPHIAMQWHSLKFIYIHDISDGNKEKQYAKENNAKYWRNGSPYGVPKKINLASRRMQVVGDLFRDGGEVYKKEELVETIQNKLGYEEKAAVRLINDCVKENFLYEMGDGLYTR